MFEALWDDISHFGSWRWPVAQGEITVAEVEEVQTTDGPTYRLSVTYKFSIGSDGPYTGECFWTPLWSLGEMERLEAAAKELYVGHPVQVRYRAKDPSVNTIDGGVEKLLERT